MDSLFFNPMPQYKISGDNINSNYASSSEHKDLFEKIEENLGEILHKQKEIKVNVYYKDKNIKEKVYTLINNHIVEFIRIEYINRKAAIYELNQIYKLSETTKLKINCLGAEETLTTDHLAELSKKSEPIIK